jgi:hypothetical protein
MDEQNALYPYNVILFSLINDICYNMDESGKHYTKK